MDCLRRFRQGFGKITDPVEKIKFTLAAYNAGIGHIYDAQRLAEKYGKDPYVWDDNVAEYIRMKNDPEYYNDPVCKHGYLRGSETFNYVREVMERYNYYLHKTGKNKEVRIAYNQWYPIAWNQSDHLIFKTGYFLLSSP